MNPQRKYKSLIFLLFAALILSACQPGPSDEEEIAVIVALTQTAAAQEIEVAAPPEATEAPEPAFHGDLQPLTPEECEQLAGFMVNRLVGPPIEQSEVAVQREGETGSGCQAIGSGTGEVFPDMFVPIEAMDGILEELGWTEDPTAPACLGAGGTGPGANNYCYTQVDAFCELFVHTDPIDEALCSDDEPIFVCFERLAPEQIIYTVEVTCARDTSPAAKPLDSDLMRIEFEPGAIHATILGEVAAGGFDHYVLSAMEGQLMTVNLLDRSDNLIAYDTAILVIWGAEGTVLISSHADALFWEGTLPFTQDYYIDVKSITDRPIPYTLEIIIPPAPTSVVFPVVESFPFGEMQSIVYTGVPPMLPPEFPVEEGLPEVVAYILTSDEGEYEVSLDYGPDCLGAGACHYGALAGMVAVSDTPVGTSSFPFALEEAQWVELAYGITGYFVEAKCGATCDDARLFWIYDGYQYMMGLKAGAMEDVIALANAAILNSVQ